MSTLSYNIVLRFKFIPYPNMISNNQEYFIDGKGFNGNDINTIFP